jgi:hypothetical protein
MSDTEFNTAIASFSQANDYEEAVAATVATGETEERRRMSLKQMLAAFGGTLLLAAVAGNSVKNNVDTNGEYAPLTQSGEQVTALYSSGALNREAVLPVPVTESQSASAEARDLARDDIDTRPMEDLVTKQMAGNTVQTGDVIYAPKDQLDPTVVQAVEAQQTGR